MNWHSFFFQSILLADEYNAIDPGTLGSRYQFDLNQPVPIQEQFDLTLNIGTAEHIFNVYQFFKTAHDRTRVGRLMSAQFAVYGLGGSRFF